MFEVNTRRRPKDTTTEIFWDFAAPCHNTLARLEAGRVTPWPASSITDTLIQSGP